VLVNHTKLVPSYPVYGVDRELAIYPHCTLTLHLGMFAEHCFHEVALWVSG